VIHWSQLKKSLEILRAVPGNAPLFVVGEAEVSRQVRGAGGHVWKLSSRMWDSINPDHVYMQAPSPDNLKMLPALNPHRIGALLVISEKLVNRVLDRPGQLRALAGCLKPGGVIVLVGGDSGLEKAEEVPGYMFREFLGKPGSGILMPEGRPVCPEPLSPFPEMTLASKADCGCGRKAACGDPASGEVWCQQCEDYRKESVQ